jgi:hypothetical protein
MTFPSRSAKSRAAFDSSDCGTVIGAILGEVGNTIPSPAPHAPRLTGHFSA